MGAGSLRKLCKMPILVTALSVAQVACGDLPDAARATYGAGRDDMSSPDAAGERGDSGGTHQEVDAKKPTNEAGRETQDGGSDRSDWVEDVTEPEEEDSDVAESLDDSASGIAARKCLALWGATPFASTYAPDKQLTASTMVLGWDKVVVTDSTQTHAPQLIVVHGAVNLIGIARFKLLNPNGWYCLASLKNVLASIAVELKQSAHLADSGLDAASVRPTGDPSVIVKADMKVEKVP